MVDRQPSFEEFLSGVFVAIGLTFVVFLSISTVYPNISVDSIPLLSLFVLSFLPPLLSGAVASFLVLRKARSKNIVDGVKIGLWTSVVGVLVGVLLGNLRGGLWMVLGYIVGSALGGILIRLLHIERGRLGNTVTEENSTSENEGHSSILTYMSGCDQIPGYVDGFFLPNPS